MYTMFGGRPSLSDAVERTHGTIPRSRITLVDRIDKAYASRITIDKPNSGGTSTRTPEVFPTPLSVSNLAKVHYQERHRG
jgi:hypothetical protein